MAEPIILAYGRGTIPEFPGIPEGIIDIIPADYVVNAMLAAAANAARAGDARLLPRVVGVSEPAAVQGSVRARQGVLRARSAAAAGPRRGQGARVDVPRQPPRRTPPAHRRDAPSTSPTRSSPTCRSPSGCATWSRASTATRGGWTSCAGTPTCTARTPRPRSSTPTTGRSSCTGRLTAADRKRFPFDAAAVDWRYYLQDVHCPAVTAGLRALSGKRREAAGPDPRARAAGARAVRHGGDDPALERRRVLRVVADGRPAVGPVAGRARERVLADPVVPDGRPARPRRVPADVLPALRGRDGRGLERLVEEIVSRVHAAEGLARPRCAGSASTAPPGTAR